MIWHFLALWCDEWIYFRKNIIVLDKSLLQSLPQYSTEFFAGCAGRASTDFWCGFLFTFIRALFYQLFFICPWDEKSLVVWLICWQLTDHASLEHLSGCRYMFSIPVIQFNKHGTKLCFDWHSVMKTNLASQGNEDRDGQCDWGRNDKQSKSVSIEKGSFVSQQSDWYSRGNARTRNKHRFIQLGIQLTEHISAPAETDNTVEMRQKEKRESAWRRVRENHASNCVHWNFRFLDWDIRLPFWIAKSTAWKKEEKFVSLLRGYKTIQWDSLLECYKDEANGICSLACPSYSAVFWQGQQRMDTKRLQWIPQSHLSTKMVPTLTLGRASKITWCAGSRIRGILRAPSEWSLVPGVNALRKVTPSAGQNPATWAIQSALDMNAQRTSVVLCAWTMGACTTEQDTNAERA